MHKVLSGVVEQKYSTLTPLWLNGAPTEEREKGMVGDLKKM